MELSEELFEKWKSLMERKYGFQSPSHQEVLEFSSDLVKFCEVLLEDDPAPATKTEIEIENKKYEQTTSDKTK